jgi:hypothetical protein
LSLGRAYDPVTGGFLQPDTADLNGRRSPEGYSLARNNPIGFQDPTGDQSSVGPQAFGMVTFAGCDAETRIRIVAAIANAILQVATLHVGRLWLFRR